MLHPHHDVVLILLAPHPPLDGSLLPLACGASVNQTHSHPFSSLSFPSLPGSLLLHRARGPGEGDPLLTRGSLLPAPLPPLDATSSSRAARHRNLLHARPSATSSRGSPTPDGASLDRSILRSPSSSRDPQLNCRVDHQLTSALHMTMYELLLICVVCTSN